MSRLSMLRLQIQQHLHADEDQCVTHLLAQNSLSEEKREKIVAEARALVEMSRQNAQSRGTLDAFLQEFGLSNKEGIALMCLAESLLRIPDAKTADKLIAEKVSIGDWKKHLGQSSSPFVNASTWGLMLTGKVIQTENFSQHSTWHENIISRMGEPVIRKAMLQAMKIMGGQYVLGRTIGEAIKRGQKDNSPDTRFSFDMLGEGARTAIDAEHYFDAYMDAIHTVGKAAKDTGVVESDGVSVKLSALHPRYEPSQHQRVMEELLPRIRLLAKTASQYNIGLSIDAEEANRLDLSLDIFQALTSDPELKNWQGLGFVMQAYQKRAPYLAQWLIALARETQRHIMVRLVKGAYWDSEIKHAQERGIDDYPVYTRKANTDLSYQVCAATLLDAQDVIFPQFATHNAYTIALIKTLGAGKRYEFQRLHGMGQLLYSQLSEQRQDSEIPLRIYAPVGAHKDLLPYLVRRLLENGANSSFVNRFMDETTPVTTLINDTINDISAHNTYRHEKIPKPNNIFGSRKNSLGLDLDDTIASEGLLTNIESLSKLSFAGGAIICGEKLPSDIPVKCPATGEIVGRTSKVSEEHIDQALLAAQSAQPHWDQQGGNYRAQILESVADIFEQHRDELIALISFEAGRTLNDAIDELREAVDFCRYYASLARQHFSSPLVMPGPTGETNELSLHGCGTFVCISPWNFPLAIFVGQISAALAAGNSVLAKPAEQTPLVASKAVELMLEAGIPANILHLLPGGGDIGAKILARPGINGVVFTGSTQTAKHIQRQLAEKDGPIIPMIAETGGQNAMIVDSTALLEQVTDDVLASAFTSAGQRCSALRVLFVQQDIADELIAKIQGACEELAVGEPWKLTTDIGPVIDRQAQQKLLTHIENMQKDAKLLFPLQAKKIKDNGHYIRPHIFELGSLAQLEGEVFGPILHIIRFKAEDQDSVVEAINATGFGLTLGVHSRIEDKAKRIFKQTNVGNTYINRNMVGAVVGVNPFGGHGLSGTGPKAGGPHYLFRFATEKTFTVNTVATGGNTELLSIED